MMSHEDDEKSLPPSAPFYDLSSEEEEESLHTWVEDDPQTILAAPKPEQVKETAKRKIVSVDDLPQTLGRYRVVSELARGGSGRVIRAVDDELAREVVIKLLLPGHSRAKVVVERFLREARITARLEHPNVVPVHDIGFFGNNEPFFAMKFVRGRSLAQILYGLRHNDAAIQKEFGRTKLLQIFQRICMGVAFAHAKGVLHRDIKPANVMIGEFGEVHVMDWGLAKDIRLPEDDNFEEAIERPKSIQLSVEGKVFGTPLYMSPEQAQGKIHEIDERSDIYSLGAILYEILTWQVLYPLRDIDAVLQAVIHQTPIPPRQRAPQRDIPEELEEICLRALHKEQPERYSSARSLHNDIESYLEGSKEREKKERDAAKKLQSGLQVRQEYEAQQLYTRQLEAQRQQLRETMPRHAPEEEKRTLWELESALAESKAAEAHLFGASLNAFQQALGVLPDYVPARQHLAELYAQRMMRAEAEQNTDRAQHYATELARFDDGQYTSLLSGLASVTVETALVGAEVFCQNIRSKEVVASLDEPTLLGVTPLDQALPMGNYLLTLEQLGQARCKIPILLRRNEELVLSLPAISSVPEGFVYIPEGPAWLGGDPLAPSSGPWRQLSVPAFFAGRFPVTMGEYLAFINALAAEDVEEARRRVPRATTASGFYWEPDVEGKFQLPMEDADGDRHHPRYPVVAISYEDALAYCTWKSTVDGYSYRLLREEEWEKAGRGADGRFFPWGDLFDAAFCKMRDSRTRRAMESVGSFGRDESIYGVRDLAGCASEWCDGWYDEQAGLRSVRGGSWTMPEQNCRLAARSGERPFVVSGARGFRLALDVF